MCKSFDASGIVSCYSFSHCGIGYCFRSFCFVVVAVLFLPSGGRADVAQTLRTFGHRPALNSVVGAVSVHLSCLTFRIIFLFLVEFWPTRESFGMARGPRFCALGVDSGPRGGAFEGFWTPPNNKKHKVKATYCQLSSQFSFYFLAWTRDQPRNGLTIDLWA